MLLLKLFICVCLGGESHPPVVLPPLPPVHHLAPHRARLLVPIEPDEGVGEGMDVAPGVARGQDGVPDLTPEAEGATVLTGDVTEQDPAPMTGPETGKGTGDDTRHVNEQGWKDDQLFINIYI